MFISIRLIGLVLILHIIRNRDLGLNKNKEEISLSPRNYWVLTSSLLSV